jgi:hypothetical protein
MERQLFIKTTLILFAILPRLYFGLDNSYQNLNLEFDNILLKTIFDFRIPHHVAYFSFGNDLNKFNFYLFMIGIALSILNRLYFILYFIIFVIFYNIAGYYFYYLNFNFEIVSLFPYRLNPLLIPIFFILSIYTLINNSINFKFKFLGLISIFLYFFYFNNLSFKIEFFLLLLLLLSYLILKIKIKNNLLEIASSILILIIFILFTPMSTKGFKNTLVDSNFRDISKYLSTNDLVLTYFDINPAFRISTGTGIIVDYKSVPAGNRQALINWYSRISDLDHLNQKEPNEILNLANKYGASAVLLSQEYLYSLLPFEKINADIYIVQKFILIKL